jgi:hypothetical protein
VALYGLSVTETVGDDLPQDTTAAYASSTFTLLPGKSVTSYSTNSYSSDTVRMVSVAANRTDGGGTVTAIASSLASVASPQPNNLTAVAGDKLVTLKWVGIVGGRYDVKRSTVAGGPYATIATGITTTNYTDLQVVNGTRYYYVVSGYDLNGLETANSPEANAMPVAPLPPGWLTRDIGTVIAAGSANYSGGKYTVAGSGKDIAGTTDGFRFLYLPASGDCTVVARVVSVGNTAKAAKAGVMIRETLTAGSKHASIFMTPNSGIIGQVRTTTSGTSVSSTATGRVAPYWIKGVRTGSTFNAYYSSNGTTWTLLASKSMTMTSSAYIGFAVTSQKDGTLCTAVFDNVTVTP